MDQPLITCCVLTYKNFDNIYSTISSILEQDYPCIELGVFDDGSDLFPKDEINKYIEEKRKSNIKHLVVFSNEKNIGTVRNINNAIKMTKGDYIIFLSSDDSFFDKQSCSKIVDFFVDNDADIITSYREVVDEKGRHIGNAPSRRSGARLSKLNAIDQYKWIAEGAPFAGAGAYYSRRIIEKYNGFDEGYCLQEDGPFFLRATRCGTRILFLDIVTYRYMLGYGVSSGSNNNPILVRDVKRMFEKEIVPYLSMFNIFEKRRIRYEMERIELNKKISAKEKLRIVLKYPEVLIYRKLFAH